MRSLARTEQILMRATLLTTNLVEAVVDENENENKNKQKENELVKGQEPREPREPREPIEPIEPIENLKDIIKKADDINFKIDIVFN